MLIKVGRWLFRRQRVLLVCKLKFIEGCVFEIEHPCDTSTFPRDKWTESEGIVQRTS